eukprot:GHVT01033467.1.p1 GENE.GHVT01033467.1~~GHVT01033467.1.p1  ORF type:complete len:236 (+),score=21.18 GHVT01033467.1:473-1180(+)
MMDEGLPTSAAARPALRPLTRLPSKITSKKSIKAPRFRRPKPDSRQFAYLLSAGVCCALLTGCSYAVYHSMKASRLARALPASTKDSFNGQAVATSLSNVPTREYNYPQGFNGSIHSLTPKLLPHTSSQAAALKSGRHSQAAARAIVLAANESVPVTSKPEEMKESLRMVHRFVVSLSSVLCFTIGLLAAVLFAVPTTPSEPRTAAGIALSTISGGALLLLVIVLIRTRCSTSRC